MELIERRIKKVINPHSLVFLIQRDCHQETDFSIDILLFLLRYSLLLLDTPSENNFSKRQFLPPGELFFQNSNGARYLDPKYSRWLSTDPALGEYVPAAGKSNEADKLPGMGGIYNSVNLSLYHYAGNNPVKYVDPDGRITSEEQKKQNELFNQILSFVEGWTSYTVLNGTKTGPRYYDVKVATISEEGITYIKNISKQACTAGAIALRNKYRDRKIPSMPYAIDLLNNYKDKSFYRYGENDYRKRGQIITDRSLLFDTIQIGDILIYTNPNNPEGDPDKGFTGHTATIIDKEKDYVTTLEFHQFGEDPSIQKLSKESLQNFYNTELYGGAKWE